MDWNAVEAARAFAERWHRGTWSVHRLPELLGAQVVHLDLDPILLGGTRADGARRLIYVHERLAGPAYVAVLGHECGHPFLGGSGTDYCSGLHGVGPREMTTNIITTMLTVPYATVRDVRLDDGSLGTTAHALCVPTQMMRVRRFAGVVLGELPGRREYALASLSAACIGLAAYFWRLSLELAASDPLAPYYRPSGPSRSASGRTSPVGAGSMRSVRRPPLYRNMEAP